MKQRPTGRPSSEKIIRDIKRNTRKQYSAEEKIRIVLDGVRGEDSIAQLCRRTIGRIAIAGVRRQQRDFLAQISYKWSKDFMEAGKQRLAGDIVRQANTSDVTALRREARDLKTKALLSPSKRWNCGCSKKTCSGMGRNSNEFILTYEMKQRPTASEKLEIIRLVERSHLPAKQTLAMLGKEVSPSTHHLLPLVRTPKQIVGHDGAR